MTFSPPAYAKTWKQLLTAGVPGQRLAFTTTVLDISQQFAFRLKDYLVNGNSTTKYTVKWTCTGITGPTNSADNTDRITSAATWITQATIAGSPQAFWVLTGQFGEQVMLAFQGSSADIMRVSFSPGGLFVLAGTTTNQPTATDEQVVCATNSVVASTASADRILQCWIRDDGKGFRYAVYRTGALTGATVCIEEFSPGWTVGANIAVSVTPAVLGLALTGGATASTSLFGSFSLNGGNGPGLAIRVTVNGSGINAQCHFGLEGGGGTNAIVTLYTAVQEAQGGTFAPYPIGIQCTATSGAKGRWGNIFDYLAVNPTGQLAGNGFGALQEWVTISGAIIWPNPSLQPMTVA